MVMSSQGVSTMRAVSRIDLANALKQLISSGVASVCGALSVNANVTVTFRGAVLLVLVEKSGKARATAQAQASALRRSHATTIS
mgnify:CR=1 FL=1